MQPVPHERREDARRRSPSRWIARRQRSGRSATTGRRSLLRVSLRRCPPCRRLPGRRRGGLPHRRIRGDRSPWPCPTNRPRSPGTVGGGSGGELPIPRVRLPLVLARCRRPPRPVRRCGRGERTLRRRGGSSRRVQFLGIGVFAIGHVENLYRHPVGAVCRPNPMRPEQHALLDFLLA